MAQMIGTSRETVTRVLGDLKRRQIAAVEGSVLMILDKSALMQIANA